MVTKVVINNNEDSPIGYLSELKAFKNGKEYVFKPGVNIIVGENGCGKFFLGRRKTRSGIQCTVRGRRSGNIL